MNGRDQTTAGAMSAADAGTYEIGGELPVHRLGYGAMRVTGPGVWGPPADHDEAIRVLRRTVELGINLIDTADSYGPEISERLIAEALYPYPRDLLIATKAGLERSGPGEWHPNGRPEHLRAACEGSLRRLRLERIDLYQLHRIDPAVPAEDQFGVLSRLQEEGKIRFVGLSEVSVAEIQRARRALPVVSVQNRYNLQDRTWDDVVDYCEREALAFLPWRPVADIVDDDDRVAAIARRHDATPAQVALAWLLARSPVVLPIPGTSSVQHLEENVAAAGVTLSDDEVRALAG